VLMGHSTGCQDAVRRVATPNATHETRGPAVHCFT
jgi:hypothetical protein